MEGTQTGKAGAGLLQLNVLTDHLNNVGGFPDPVFDFFSLMRHCHNSTNREIYHVKYWLECGIIKKEGYS